MIVNSGSPSKFHDDSDILAARLRCPDPDHAGSKIKLDGTYGKPGHRRQRYKCRPKAGRPHVFTELLPREEPWHGACDHCERQVDRREGPKLRSMIHAQPGRSRLNDAGGPVLRFAGNSPQ